MPLYTIENEDSINELRTFFSFLSRFLWLKEVFWVFPLILQKLYYYLGSLLLFGKIENDRIRRWKEKITVCGNELEIEWRVPKSNSNEILPCVFYYHGGGWIFNPAYAYEVLLERLCLSGKTVVYINYYLSPSLTGEDHLQHCTDILFHILNTCSSRIDMQQIILAGDSAGGSIVSNISFRFPSLVSKQILLFPVLSDRMINENYFADPVLSSAEMKLYWEYYQPDLEKRLILSPLYFDYSSKRCYPKTLIITGSEDLLFSDAQQFYLNLEKENFGEEQITLVNYIGMTHVFFLLFPSIPNTHDLFYRIINF